MSLIKLIITFCQKKNKNIGMSFCFLKNMFVLSVSQDTKDKNEICILTNFTPPN